MIPIYNTFSTAQQEEESIKLSNHLQNNLLNYIKGLKNSYIFDEEYLRNLIIFLLKTIGITVWDCRPENCSEFVMIDNVPLKSTVGDFIYRLNGIHKVGEVKFFGRFCQRGRVEIRRNYLTEPQLSIFENNTGIGIFVAEPYPDEMKWKREIQCKESLKEIREMLGRSRLPYEVIIINQEAFTILKQNYLKTRRFQSKLGPFHTKQKRISWGKLTKFLPVYKIFLKDFGKIIRICIG